MLSGGSPRNAYVARIYGHAARTPPDPRADHGDELIGFSNIPYIFGRLR